MPELFWREMLSFEMRSNCVAGVIHCYAGLVYLFLLLQAIPAGCSNLNQLAIPVNYVFMKVSMICLCTLKCSTFTFASDTLMICLKFSFPFLANLRTWSIQFPQQLQAWLTGLMQRSQTLEGCRTLRFAVQISNSEWMQSSTTFTCTCALLCPLNVA